MNPEGRVEISATLTGSQIGELSIAAKRPQLAGQLLLGCQPEQAIERLEQLCVVCRQSQKGAALLALGCDLDSRLVQQRIVLESIEQLLWRLAIDLPHYLAQGVGVEPFALIRRIISNQLAAEALSDDGCT